MVIPEMFPGVFLAQLLQFDRVELYLNITFIYMNSLTIVSPGSTCFRCPAYSGLFPDPFDCEKFYHCDHWIAYHKDCPLRDTASTRLHFNDRLKVR